MKKILLAGLLVLLIAGAFKLLSSDNEAAIELRLTELETALILHDSENRLEAATRAKEIANYFSASFRAKGPEGERSYNFEDRKDLQNKITSYRIQATKMEVKFDIEDIEVESNSASLKLKVAVLGAFSEVHGEFFDLHLVELGMEKASGNWLISSAEHLENLRGAPNLEDSP